MDSDDARWLWSGSVNSGEIREMYDCAQWFEIGYRRETGRRFGRVRR